MTLGFVNYSCPNWFTRVADDRVSRIHELCCHSFPQVFQNPFEGTLHSFTVYGFMSSYLDTIEDLAGTA